MQAEGLRLDTEGKILYIYLRMFKEMQKTFAYMYMGGGRTTP